MCPATGSTFFTSPADAGSSISQLPILRIPWLPQIAFCAGWDYSDAPTQAGWQSPGRIHSLTPGLQPWGFLLHPPQTFRLVMTSPSLSGRRIAVTRASEQSGSLRTLLEERGAEVLELPLITVTEEIDKQTLADCMLELGSYDWLVFTSANGVRYFFGQFMKLFDDIRSLGLTRVACVGDATAEAVRAYYLKVECQPKRATAEDLADALIATGSLDHVKVLIITGNLNRDVIVHKLEEARAIVDRLQVYKTERTDLTGHPAAAEFRERGADAVLFTSSSAAESFAAQADALNLGRNAKVPIYGSIGSQTSESLRKAGLEPSFEAKSHGLRELVDGLQKALTKTKA